MKRNEVRFGSRQSKCVRPAPVNTWHDHETAEGGGYLDLYVKKYGRVPNPPAFPIPPGMAKELGEPVMWWDYPDGHGTVVARVVRFHPPSGGKTYRQCRPDGASWRWNMKGVEVPLYHAPDLARAQDGATVFIAEGEKCVNALRAWGLTATTNAGGASKFLPRHAGALVRFKCVILPDNDAPGRKHASLVVKLLRQAGCADVRVVNLPGLPEKGDVADWIADGGTPEKLAEIVAAAHQAAIEDEPAADAEPRERTKQRRGKTHAPDIDAGPTVRILAGELHRVATEAEAAIIAADLPIYQRGANLVRPATFDVTASHGETTIAAGLRSMDAPGLIDAMSSTARFEKFDGRSNGFVRCDPPQMAASILLSRAGQWNVPRIAGVITSPTLRPDGSLLLTPGYDPSTRLYHVRDPALQMPAMPDKPTKADADCAMDTLQGILAGFPFVSDTDRAVALSGMITPVVRAMMPVAPMHGIRATDAGTGKSFLVDVFSVTSTGRPCPVIAAGRDEAETEKRLVGLLLSGFPVISLDNVNGELAGDLLCQATERPLIKVRPLGASDTAEIENRVSVFATGNGLRVVGDMTRRTLICSLDAGVERPELRTFDFDPLQQVLANRGLYLAACLTVVRAYIAAGYPISLPPLASYGVWSNTVRSALVWLGCDDPVVAMNTARDDDPELAALREVVTAWAQYLTVGMRYTAKSIVDEAESRSLDPDTGRQTDRFRFPELRDALLKIAGERGSINTKRLGNWLQGREGRIINGLRVRRSKELHRTGVVVWFLEKA